MSLHNRATLSIVGLYNWDDTIFDDMVLPDGIDKNEIIEDILFQCAELEIVYPDWGVMKQAIATWSNEELFKWNKIQKLAELEYNPIENYDRMETETINDSKATTAENTTVANSAGREQRRQVLLRFQQTGSQLLRYRIFLSEYSKHWS